MLLRSKDKPDVGSTVLYSIKEEEGAPECDSLPSGSRRLLHSSYKLLLLSLIIPQEVRAAPRLGAVLHKMYRTPVSGKPK